jgi:hypothetical protein
MHFDGPAYELNGPRFNVRLRLLLPHVVVEVPMQVRDGLLVVHGHGIT